MEHRWGERVAVDIPIRLLATHLLLVGSGRLVNLSLSGGLIATDLDLRVFSRVQVVVESPLQEKHVAPTLAAYAVRKCIEGIAVEWCELAPPAVAELCRAASIRPRAQRADGPRYFVQNDSLSDNSGRF